MIKQKIETSIYRRKIMEQKWWHHSVVYQIYPRSFQDSNQDGIEICGDYFQVGLSGVFRY